jgi:hypothetical protein
MNDCVINAPPLVSTTHFPIMFYLSLLLNTILISVKYSKAKPRTSLRVSNSVNPINTLTANRGAQLMLVYLVV